MKQITKLLIAGRLNVELREYFSKKGYEFQYLLKEPSEVTNEDLQWADAYLSFNPPVNAELKHVKWVHTLGAGVDAYLFRKSWPDATILTRTDGDFGKKIGQHCLTRALAQCQHLRKYFSDQDNKRWSRQDSKLIDGSKVLIIGAGIIGAVISRYFKAFNCQVDGVTRSVREKEGFDKIITFTELPEEIGKYDFIILSTPLTEETYKFIGRELLSKCTGAYLINIARGAEIDDEALAEALDKGWLSGAALDVFAVEPLPQESPLWLHEKITFSPHVAALTEVHEAGDSFLACLKAFQKGEKPYLQADVLKGY